MLNNPKQYFYFELMTQIDVIYYQQMLIFMPILIKMIRN